jgi:hypothetical protein
VYLLYLNGKTGILLLDSITNSIVFQLVLLKLMAHHVVTILDRALYLLLASLREIELHYGIIFELWFTDDVQPSLRFRKDRESCKVLVSGLESVEVFNDKLRVLSELNEEVLVGLDALELPIVALKEEVEVDFCVAGEFHLDGLGEFVLILHHNLHSQLLWFLERLHNLRLLLDANDKAMLAAVNYLTAFAHCRVHNASRRFDAHHLHHRPVRALVHYIE